MRLVHAGEQQVLVCTLRGALAGNQQQQLQHRA
jgi:hypothetical protein